jgi:PAS domain S-box-containing protein
MNNKLKEIKDRFNAIDFNNGPENKAQLTDIFYELFSIAGNAVENKETTKFDERFKNALDQSPVPVIIHADFKTIYINKSAVAAFGGYSIEEFIGFEIWTFIDPRYHEAVKERIKIVYSQKSSVPTMELPFVKRDGTPFLVEAAASSIEFYGKPASQVVFNDISARKRTEIEMNQINSNLKAMINNTDDYIMIADKNGFPIMFNDNYKTIIEQGLNIVMRPGIKPHKLSENKEEVKFWDSIHERVLSGEKFKAQFQQNINGTIRYFEFSFYPIFLDGKVNGFAEHSRDITNIKDYENKLKLAKEKAEQSDKLKTTFLANMSHEIRTPMNAITGFADLLNTENLSKIERNEYVEIINKSSKQLLSIINDIVDISKIELGQVEFHPYSFNINELLRDLNMQFDKRRDELNKPSVKISNYCELKDKDAYIKTDLTRLTQILNNLIFNALKFTHNGEITFGYNVISNKTISFYVKDTGIGIAKKDIHKIFERFHQSNEDDKVHYGGTGLGLSITKGLIEIFGGEIKVHSERGKGSNFLFTIPYVAGEKTNKSKSSDNSIADYKFDLSNKDILLVEDNDLIIKYLSNIINTTKANLYIAKTGKEAVNHVKDKGTVDLVLMDIQLPDINGYEATKRIHEINNKIPVVAQTAQALTRDKEKCIKMGCIDYLSKPINKITLLNMLKKYLV